MLANNESTNQQIKNMQEGFRIERCMTRRTVTPLPVPPSMNMMNCNSSCSWMVAPVTVSPSVLSCIFRFEILLAYFWFVDLLIRCLLAFAVSKLLQFIMFMDGGAGNGVTVHLVMHLSTRKTFLHIFDLFISSFVHCEHSPCRNCCNSSCSWMVAPVMVLPFVGLIMLL